jgi:hypothetical protein
MALRVCPQAFWDQQQTEKQGLSPASFSTNTSTVTTVRGWTGLVARLIQDCGRKSGGTHYEI